MAKLQNTFSWSFSAAEDFEECRRRRYWSKYAKWGGWERDATAQQRAAYRLDKMDNRFSLQGRAVEQAVMWLLRRRQQGMSTDVEEAYQQVARPYLNTCWRESRDGLWRRDAKRHCSLHEHYYPRLHAGEDPAWAEQVAASTRRCIAGFIEDVLPRLDGVLPEHEIPIAASASGGDPESFTIEGVKIYAIPDYAYRRDGRVVIHDWKSGKPKVSHRTQVALYGLWAHRKHGADPETIDVMLEYLAHGETVSQTMSAELLQEVLQAIGESVADMTVYLVGEDRERNRPVPQAEWDLAADRSACRWCNFYELCEPELVSDA